MSFEIEIPKGRTSEKWFGMGYQSAMQDIARELAEGGPEAVTEWLSNNNRTAPAVEPAPVDTPSMTQALAGTTDIAQSPTERGQGNQASCSLLNRPDGGGLLPSSETSREGTTMEVFRTDAEREAYRLLHEQGSAAFDLKYGMAGSHVLNEWADKGLVRISYPNGCVTVKTFKKYVPPGHRDSPICAGKV